MIGAAETQIMRVSEDLGDRTEVNLSSEGGKQQDIVVFVEYLSAGLVNRRDNRPFW